MDNEVKQLLGKMVELTGMLEREVSELMLAVLPQRLSDEGKAELNLRLSALYEATGAMRQLAESSLESRGLSPLHKDGQS